MIYLNKVGKRFKGHWVFKRLTYTFQEKGVYALLGANGSGKSTLLKVIAGMQGVTVGKCRYEINKQEVLQDKIFNYLSYCAPAMALIEEMSLRELLTFHFGFKKMLPGWSINRIIDFLNFQAIDKQLLHEYSSGMKQRVKLAQAFFTDSPILLLDEPCNNLDEPGIQLYEQLMATLTRDRLVIIASNVEREYRMAKEQLQLHDYKFIE